MSVYGTVETGFDVRHLQPLEGLQRVAAELIKAGCRPLAALVSPHDYVNIEMCLSYAAHYAGDALVLHTPRSLYVEVSAPQPEGEATMIYQRSGDAEEKKVMVRLAQ